MFLNKGIPFTQVTAPENQIPDKTFGNDNLFICYLSSPNESIGDMVLSVGAAIMPHYKKRETQGHHESNRRVSLYSESNNVSCVSLFLA
jgi:hypothetical protein